MTQEDRREPGDVDLRAMLTDIGFDSESIDRMLEAQEARYYRVQRPESLSEWLRENIIPAILATERRRILESEDE